MSDADVESYKQIKSDLDVLRQSVEKSELWVYKSRNGDDHGKKHKDDDDEAGTIQVPVFERSRNRGRGRIIRRKIL